jgi:hypothetical protein
VVDPIGDEVVRSANLRDAPGIRDLEDLDTPRHHLLVECLQDGEGAEEMLQNLEERYDMDRRFAARNELFNAFIDSRLTLSARSPRAVPRPRDRNPRGLGGRASPTLAESLGGRMPSEFFEQWEEQNREAA